jgi:RHS repeat-associated protein
MRLYVDGVVDATLSTTNGPASGTSSLQIGKASYGSPFGGLIDEARVSNTAIYTSNFTPQTHLTASSSTKGLWKFDGPSIADSSGNGNNGTLQSGATYLNDVPGGSGGIGSQVQWLISDHLGTPRMIVDQAGTLANLKRHDYLPFGEELVAPAGGRSTALGYSSGDGVRQQFTAKERDIETGLDYFEARYYASIQGRFTSPDEFRGGPDELYVLGTGDEQKQALPYAEITNPQSINKYSYVYNNPLRFIDSNGHQGQEKKSLMDRLLEYLGQIWKSKNPQDGMTPGSGNGEIQKPEQNGPLDADPNRLADQATRAVGKGLDTYAEVLATVEPTGIASASKGYLEGDYTRVGISLAGAVLHVGGASVTMREARSLLSVWSRETTQGMRSQLIKHAFEGHGAEVGAKNVVEYMRKAAAFSTKGLKREVFENGARIRYLRKDGYYVIKDASGKIVSFGRN